MRISTHTSRVGCDKIPYWLYTYLDNFYSHIPCGMWQKTHEGVRTKSIISTHTSRVGCDVNTFFFGTSKPIFLLTHPVWDVTPATRRDRSTGLNFYSHIPCGMWQHIAKAEEGQVHFYSHIPCGMWHLQMNRFPRLSRFLLTHPVWDVTGAGVADADTIYNFYSHIPCGMWPCSSVSVMLFKNFYSHIPCGMWLYRHLWPCGRKNFYSHIPCGMWLGDSQRNNYAVKFLLTHPVWDVTPSSALWLSRVLISTHTSRVGCDPFYFLQP